MITAKTNLTTHDLAFLRIILNIVKPLTDPGTPGKRNKPAGSEDTLPASGQNHENSDSKQGLIC